MGKVATVAMPVRSCNICGPGASNAASPRNLLSTNPWINARSSCGSSAHVPYRWANAPPRSISVTSRHAAWQCFATRMLTMSQSCRLISAGDPAPSITTTSYSARKSSSAAAICGQTLGPRSRQGMAVNSSLTCPISTTWLWVSRSGLSSTGFMRTSGTALAAKA